MKFRYIKQLQKDLQNLEYHQRLFKLLKAELSKLGYWQNKPRGNPSKGYQAMKEHEQKNQP